MNIDKTEENFRVLIKCLNFIRELGVDYQFDNSHPDYSGMINTIPADHGISNEEVEYIKKYTFKFNVILRPIGLEIVKARPEEFILIEI